MPLKNLDNKFSLNKNLHNIHNENPKKEYQSYFY